MRRDRLAVRAMACFWAAVLLWLFGGCGWFSVVRGPARFTHRGHAAKGITCDACHHGGESQSTVAMPAYATCHACHGPTADRAPYAYEIEIQQQDPAMNFATPARFADLRFAHSDHSQSEISCSVCHSDPDAATGSASRAALCEGCHSEVAAKADCSYCHRELRQDRRPASHAGATWRRNHGLDVSAGWTEGHVNSCSLCHSQGDCDACHQVEKPRNHNEFFGERGHGVLAGFERERCRTCHQESFCVECHLENEPRSHHRASWAGTKSNHCLSCHEPVGESRCSVCHRGATSHLLATPVPTPPHPGVASDCRQCHLRPPHADNGMSCTVCHK